MGVAKYRPAIKIVLKLLDCIAKSQSKGRALKTHREVYQHAKRCRICGGEESGMGGEGGNCV